MIVEDLMEPISVRADFTGGALRPRLFERAGKTHKIESVNGTWIDRDGARPRYHFSIQSGGDTYFLVLRTEDMTWWLEKVILDG